MIVTYTGRYFDYGNITKDSINLEDIVHALARTNRYMGHTKRAYSVGEHTLNCYILARDLGYSLREQLLVFIHDFTEAYCGDVNTDLKNLLPEYKKIEREIELAICDYLGIAPPTEAEEKKVKRIDYTMLVMEMRDLTHHDYLEQIKGMEDYVIMDVVNNPIYYVPDEDKAVSEDEVISQLSRVFSELFKKYKGIKL